MWFRLIFHIKLVTFKILILYEFMGRLLLNLVSILFLAHNFLFKLDNIFIYEFRRAPKILLLGHIVCVWPRYVRGCTAGTGGRFGSMTPSKVRSKVSVCWATAISKTSFTKNRVNPS